MDYGGNLIDTTFLAATTALRNTSIPKLIIEDIGDGQMEFEISDDTTGIENVDVSNVPIAVTVHEINNHFVIDPTPQEHIISQFALTCFIHPSTNKLQSMHKGSMSALRNEVLQECVNVAKGVAMEVSVAVKKCWEREDRLRISGQGRKVGLLGI